MYRRAAFAGPINRQRRSIRRTMAHDLPEYTIQEAAARLGIPLQKLRRWDAQGVLVARRTNGGHRRYSCEIIDGLAGSAAVSMPERIDPDRTETGKVEDQLAAARRTLREKRRIIQLLLESESRYRDLVETSHDLIWTTDAQGRFTYLNNACVELFGLRPRDLLGRCFFQPPLPVGPAQERGSKELPHPPDFDQWHGPLGRHQRAGIARRRGPHRRPARNRAQCHRAA
jgi:excisionase family DNA binding protein